MLAQRDLYMTRNVGQQVVSGVQRANEAMFHNSWCNIVAGKGISAGPLLQRLLLGRVGCTRVVRC